MLNLGEEKIIDVRVEHAAGCPLPWFVDLILQRVGDPASSACNLSAHQHRYQAERAASCARSSYKLT